MQGSKPHIVTELRETLLTDIKLQGELKVMQEAIFSLFNKILRRLSVIFLTMSATLILGIIYIIYIVKQPISKTEMAMKQVEEMSYNIVMQRKFIEMNRDDINLLMKLRDSISKNNKLIMKLNSKITDMKQRSNR